MSSRLPNACFADTLNRKYRIDSPANALESMSYATKTAGVEPHVIGRIKKALDIYGLEAPVPELTKEAATFEDVVYILPKYNKLPVKTASDIKLAEQAVLRNSSKLNTSTLAEAASRLVKLAAKNDVELTEDTMQMAGLTQCDLEKTASWIDARGSITGNDVFYKLADRIRGPRGPSSRADLVKLSSAVDQLDSKFGLDKYYNKKLPNPLQTVFSTKVAMSSMIDMGSCSMPASKLSSLPVTFYSDVLGDDVADEISKDGTVDPSLLAEVLPTLPKDMKELLVKKVKETGL